MTAVERHSDRGTAWGVEVTHGDGAQVDVDVDAGLVAIDDPE